MEHREYAAGDHYRAEPATDNLDGDYVILYLGVPVATIHTGWSMLAEDIAAYLNERDTL